MLAFLFDVFARSLNLATGFPWPAAVHLNIQVVGTGFGAGIGAYVPWTNLGHRWYVIAGSVAVVLAGAIAGAYLGLAFGPGVDPTYWWSRFASDTTIHMVSAASGAAAATIVGVVDQAKAKSRLQRSLGPYRQDWRG